MARTKNNGALIRAQNPIDRFFARYNQFDYNPQSAAWAEFNRLCIFFGWEKGNKKKSAANALLREAIVAQFGVFYGVDENKLDTLQRLCNKLEILPTPQSITSCKKTLKTVHVNIMDFIDSERTGEPVHKFNHLSELRRYTHKEQKFFPKREAKDSSLLRYLLRRIL